MKKKVLLIVIPIILVIVLVSAIIIGIVLNKDKEEESVGSKWGDTYYAYLKEAVNEKDLTSAEEKYGMMLDMKNAQIQFCEVEEGQDPTMVMTYEKNESSYVNVYQITNKNKVNYIAYKQPTEVEYLYDIAKDEYSWYVHTKSNNNESYSSLKNVSSKLKDSSEKSDKSENVNIAELEADYTIKKDEAEVSVENTKGEKISYSKFDEIFVKPDIEPNKKIDFNVDIKEKDLKSAITGAVKNYEEESKKITEEVKEEVSKKVEEVKLKVEEVKKAKEEVEKKKAEEAKGLQVGKYTLKYGTYTSDIMDSNLHGTITLNYGGTFHIKSNYDEASAQKDGGRDEDGKYEVQLNQPDGYFGVTNYIKFKTNSGYEFYFEVKNNDSLTDQYHGYYYGTTKKTYPGTSSSNNTSTSNTNTSGSNTSSTNTSSKGVLTEFEYDPSANDPIPAGTYYRDKGKGTESVLEITNPTGNSFEFKVSAIYTTSAGYPNFGEASGTAKAIKGGSYVYTMKENGFEYNLFFRTAGGADNLTITLEEECYNHNTNQKEYTSPYCGHNVYLNGLYKK